MTDLNGPRAGIHLDGDTATVVVLKTERTHPRLAEVHQARGFGPADALASALRLVPADAPVRVSLSAAGQLSGVIASPALAPSRTEFDTAARTSLGDAADHAAIAGDPTTGHGQSVVVAAPVAAVADTFRELQGRAWAEVTSAALTAPWVDGVYLALRRETSEVTLVSGGHTLAAHTLFSAMSPAAGDPGGGPNSTPIPAALTREWVAAVVSEAAQVLSRWVREGHHLDGGLYVHGRHADAGQLDDLLTAAGLRLLPHPIGDLPHPDPLDAVDAYLAAATLGRGLPYTTFPAPVAHRPAPSDAQPTAPTIVVVADPTRAGTVNATGHETGTASAAAPAGPPPGSWSHAAAPTRTTVPTPAPGPASRARRAPWLVATGLALAVGAAGAAYGLHAPPAARDQRQEVLAETKAAAEAAAIEQVLAGGQTSSTLPAVLDALTASGITQVTAERNGPQTVVTVHGTPAARTSWLADLKRAANPQTVNETTGGDTTTVTLTAAVD